MQVMKDEQIPKIMKTKYVADEYDPEQIKQYSELLTKTDNIMVFLKSKSFEENKDIQLEQEYWYKTKHNVEQFSPELLQKMQSPNVDVSEKKLDLPLENTLIPENLEVLAKNPTASAKTHLLKQWDGVDLWFKKDDKFDMPKAMVNMKIYTADGDFGKSPEQHMFVMLWNEVMREHLREFNYMADCAKMNYMLDIHQDNIEIQMAGFNDKMSTYAIEIVQRMLDMKNADLSHTFENIKEKLLIDWKNFYLNQTFQ